MMQLLLQISWFANVLDALRWWQYLVSVLRGDKSRYSNTYGYVYPNIQLGFNFTNTSRNGRQLFSSNSIEKLMSGLSMWSSVIYTHKTIWWVYPWTNTLVLGLLALCRCLIKLDTSINPFLLHQFLHTIDPRKRRRFMWCTL